MGYKCSFMDNEAYTAQDVNDAIGRIAGDGAAFSDAGDTLADLNTALAGIVGSGTQLCGCGVTETDGVYKIGAGTCFMEDGSQITFDSDGYEITPEAEVKNYVYVKRNVTENTIDVIVSQTPGSGDFVPLAEIAEDGSVSDTRKFATAKVVLKSGQNIPARSFTVKGRVPQKSTIIFSVNAGYSEWKYLIWSYNGNLCIIALSSGESKNVPRDNYASTSGVMMDAKKEGNQIIFTVWNNTVIEFKLNDFTFELR